LEFGVGLRPELVELGLRDGTDVLGAAGGRSGGGAGAEGERDGGGEQEGFHGGPTPFRQEALVPGFGRRGCKACPSSAPCGAPSPRGRGEGTAAGWSRCRGWRLSGR